MEGRTYCVCVDGAFIGKPKGSRNPCWIYRHVLIVVTDIGVLLEWDTATTVLQTCGGTATTPKLIKTNQSQNINRTKS